MLRGNSQSRLRDSISMGCGPFARISFTSLSFPGLPVTNTVRVECCGVFGGWWEGGEEFRIQAEQTGTRVSLRDYAEIDDVGQQCRGEGGVIGGGNRDPYRCVLRT
jgi:hypothetical protein